MFTRNIKRMKGLPISKKVPGVHILPGGVGSVKETKKKETLKGNGSYCGPTNASL